jgi:hypothetical protein
LEQAGEIRNMIHDKHAGVEVGLPVGIAELRRVKQLGESNGGRQT